MPKENIVKKTCKELGITQKELAERIGVKPSAVSNWANGDIPTTIEFTLNTLIENNKLAKKIKIIKDFKTFLDTI